MIYTMSRRPAPLQPAPKAVDAALLHDLLADRAKLHGWAVTLPTRCAQLQRAILRGYWYSAADLRRTQKAARTVLAAARAHRDLQDETLAALDLVVAFCNGIQIDTSATVAA